MGGSIYDLVPELVPLRVLWLTLRGLLACSPALRQPFVQTLSRDAFTIVFWPDRQAIRLRRREAAPTSTAKRSIWSRLRWMLSQMLATRGNNGAVPGTQEMPSTSSYPEPQNGRNKKA